MPLIFLQYMYQPRAAGAYQDQRHLRLSRSQLELSVPRDEGFTLSAPSEAKEEAITEFLS